MSSHYAALLSLKHTIVRLKYLTEVSVLPWFPLIDSLYGNVLSLQDFLTAFHGRDWNDFYEDLREVICKMEDVLESQMSAHLLAGSEKLPIDICKVEQQIDLFCERVNEIKECLSCNFEYLYVPPPPPRPSRHWFPTKDSSARRLVGMQHEQEELKRHLFSYGGHAIEISGMAGIGKTALAKAVCEDPQVWNHFDNHIFVPVGQNRKWKEILLCIMSQLNYSGDDSDEYEVLEKCVLSTLYGRKCLILLDDVWHDYIWSKLVLFLEDNSSRVVGND